MAISLTQIERVSGSANQYSSPHPFESDTVALTCGLSACAVGNPDAGVGLGVPSRPQIPVNAGRDRRTVAAKWQRRSVTGT